MQELLQQITEAREKAESESINRPVKRPQSARAAISDTLAAAKAKLQAAQKARGTSDLFAAMTQNRPASASGQAKCPNGAKVLTRTAPGQVMTTRLRSARRPRSGGTEVRRRRDLPFRGGLCKDGVFDPKIGVLRMNNFDTWDKHRCCTPERTWPCAGAIAQLYDQKRRGKQDWLIGNPQGTFFGMAHSDVAGDGSVIAAALRKAERLRKMAAEAGKDLLEADNTNQEVEQQAVRRIVYHGGHAVELDF